MNEITGFLDNGSVRKRPRALNLYGPYRDQEELEKDLLGTARSGRLTGKFPKSAKSAKSQRTIHRKPSYGSTTPVESDSEEELPPDDMDDLDDEVDLVFDIQVYHTLMEPRPLKRLSRRFLIQSRSQICNMNLPSRFMNHHYLLWHLSLPLKRLTTRIWTALD